MQTPAVSIIVLNWNTPGDTLECLASLASVEYPRYNVIVVDNGSGESCVRRIRAAFPEITLLRNPTNLGFAEGNNVGIRYAIEHGAEALLLLNSDTTVNKGSVEALCRAAADCPQPGVFGAKIYYASEPNRIWMGMPLWDPRGARFEYLGMNEEDSGSRYSAIRPVSYVCGCAMFCAAGLVHTIGLMDPRFFCYFEEVDWCFRAARHGFTNYYVPAARVWHKVSASSGGSASPVVQYFRTRNNLLWAKRQLPPRQVAKIWGHTLSDAFAGLHWHDGWRPAGLRRVYWNLLTLKHDPLRKARLLGIRDYLRRRFGDAPDEVKALKCSPAIRDE